MTIHPLQPAPAARGPHVVVVDHGGRDLRYRAQGTIAACADPPTRVNRVA